MLTPLRAPNLRVLSPADLSSLDTAISKYGKMSFASLKKISHGELDYVGADENDFMSFDRFVESLDNNEHIRSFIRDCVEETC